MRKLFLVPLSILLPLAWSCRAGDSGFLDDPFHITSVSGGCLVDPRPRPGPYPPDNQRALFRDDGRHHLVVEYVTHYAVDHTPPYTVRFTFTVGAGDRLHLGPYRADAPSHVVAPGDHTVVLSLVNGVVQLTLDANNPVANQHDGVIDLRGPVTEPTGVRLTKIPVNAVLQGAIGIELEAFGVQTGFTLIDDLTPGNPPTGTQLLLRPRWTVAEEPRGTDRIVEIRAKADASQREYWHPVEYWPVRLDDQYRVGGRYDIGFGFHLRQDEFVYLGTYRSAEGKMKLEGGKKPEGTDWVVRLRYGGSGLDVYQVEKEGNQDVLVKKRNLTNARDGRLSSEGVLERVTAIDLGTRDPIDDDDYNTTGKWGVVGIEVEAWGLRTGFSLIAPKIDVQPKWTRPAPPTDP